MKVRIRRGTTLLEVIVAITILVGIFAGIAMSMRFFSRPTRHGDTVLDQLQSLSTGTQKLDMELREARQVIFPPPGALPSRFLYLRGFDGRLVGYYFNPGRRELRRVAFDLGGLPREDTQPPCVNVDGAYFHSSRPGLLSWAVFTPDAMLMGSAVRRNQ